MIDNRNKSLTKAKTQLKDFFRIFNESVVEGYRDFISAIQEYSGVYDKTTRANMIQNHIFYHLKKELFGNNRVTMLGQGKLSMINIDNEFLFKVKKLDKNHRSSNIKSKQVLKFNNQKPLFEDIEQMIHLELGYTIDAIGSSVTNVLIVQPKNSNKNLWEINLAHELGLPVAATLFNEYHIDDEQPEYGMPKLKVSDKNNDEFNKNATEYRKVV